MASMLAKLGIPQSVSIESRKLSVDIAGTIIYWERSRISKAANGSEATEGGGDIEMTECTQKTPIEMTDVGPNDKLIE